MKDVNKRRNAMRNFFISLMVVFVATVPNMSLAQTTLETAEFLSEFDENTGRLAITFFATDGKLFADRVTTFNEDTLSGKIKNKKVREAVLAKLGVAANTVKGAVTPLAHTATADTAAMPEALEAFYNALGKFGCAPVSGSDFSDAILYKDKKPSGPAWEGCEDLHSNVLELIAILKGQMTEEEAYLIVGGEMMAEAYSDTVLPFNDRPRQLLFLIGDIFNTDTKFWQPLVNTASANLGEETSTTDLSDGSTAKAVCVGREPVVGKVISKTADEVVIEDADGNTVTIDNLEDCVFYTANSMPDIKEGLEEGNRMIFVTADEHGIGTIEEIDGDKVTLEKDDGELVELFMTGEVMMIGWADTNKSGLALSIEGAAYIGVSNPDNTDNVVGQTTMLILRWYPKATKGIIDVHVGGGFGWQFGNTTYGVDDNSNRAFFVGNVGVGAGYDVTDWFRPEVIGNLLYTNSGVGGEGGFDAVFTVHKHVKLRVGCKAAWMPSGVVPDTRPGRSETELDYFAIVPSLGLDIWFDLP